MSSVTSDKEFCSCQFVSQNEQNVSTRMTRLTLASAQHIQICHNTCTVSGLQVQVSRQVKDEDMTELLQQKLQ